MGIKWISCILILMCCFVRSNTSIAQLQDKVLNPVLFESLIEQTILPNDRLNADYGQFGHSISVDGNRMLVGAYNASESGLAYVYEFHDDMWNQVAVLNNNRQNANNQFGYSVSLLGNRAIVGAPFGNGSFDSSAVYVFDLIEGDWQETQVLFPAENLLFSRFGASVSLITDRILIGSPNEGEDSAGAAYVYDYNNSNWELTQRFQSDDVQSSDNFGWSVSLQNNTAIISAPNDDDLGDNSGAAYLFNFDGLSWQQTAKIVAEDSFAGERFGHRVDIDQQRLVVGSDISANAVTNNSFVYIFELINGNWLFTQKLTEGSNQSQFGSSVNLNGNYLVVGATSYPFCCNKTGAVFLYEYLNGSWERQRTIVPASESNSSRFGSSVVITDSQILVGANRHQGGAVNSGSVFWYTNENNNGVENDFISIENHGYLNNFGISIKLDGKTLMSGAPDRFFNPELPGSVYVFNKNNLSWIQSQKLVASDATTGDYFGHAISLEGDRALISAPKDFVINAEESGVIYYFKLIDGQWHEQQIIIPSDPKVGDLFGFSIILQGDLAVVGAPGHFDDLTAGTVYVYQYLNNSWQELTKLQAPDGQLGDGFGFSLDLYQNKLLIGAPLQSAAAHVNSGSAYVYEQINETWQFKQKISIDGGDGFIYGSSVSFFNEDILIGSPGDDAAGFAVGAVYTYQFLNGMWEQKDQLIPEYYDGNDWFGFAMSTDHNKVVIGTFQQQGSAPEFSYIYQKTNQDWQQMSKVSHNVSDHESYGFAVDIDGSNVAVGAPSSKVHGRDSGIAYVYSFDLIFKNDFE